MKVPLASLVIGVLVSLCLPQIVQAAQSPRTFALVPKTKDNPYFNAAAEGAKAEAAKLGVDCLYAEPEDEEATAQAQVFKGLIDKKVNGIAVSPMVADALLDSIRQARRRGIPVITFDSDSPHADRACYVGTNNIAAGEEAGKAFHALLPKGHFAIVTGGLGSANLNERIKGFRELVGVDDYIEVPGSPFPCDDNTARANRVLQDLIEQHPELEGIFLTGGWPLYGSPDDYKKALGKRAEDIKSNKLILIGFDGLRPELELLKEGLCSTLIAQRPAAMGSTSMQLLNDLANGRRVRNVDTGVDVINRTNVDDFLK